MAGVTPQGFVTKRADDLVPEVEAIFVSAYGSGIDLSPASRQGQQVAGMADALAEVWEVAQSVYQNRDMTQAEGGNIDQWGANFGYRGRNVDESDESYLTAILGPPDTSSNLTDDIQAKIADLDDVTLVYNIINYTNATDVNGLPPKSYAVVIEGGEPTDIAPILWSSQPTGIEPVGTDTLQTVDNQGFCRDVKYSKVVKVDISIALTVSVFQAHCECGTPNIPQIQAQTVANLQEVQDGCRVGIGQDLLVSQVFAAAASIPGVDVSEVLISKTPNPPAAADVDLLYYEVANFSVANVTVTIE